MNPGGGSYPRPGPRVLDRASRALAKLGSGALVVRAGSAWVSAWPGVLPAAILIAGAGLLGGLEPGTPLLRAPLLVLSFALASLGESAALGMARTLPGRPEGPVRVWSGALRIFGEVFVVELCFWALFLFLMAVPLSILGPQQGSAGAGALAMLAFLVPGLYVSARWSTAKAALVTEEPGPIPALKASWRATQGRVPAVVKIWLLAGLPLAGVNLAFRLPPPSPLPPLLDGALWLFHGLLVTWLSFVGTAQYLAFRRPAPQPSQAAS